MKNEKLSIKRYSSYKNTGFEWLGEVPEHWKTVRAKDICKIFVPQRDKPELDEESGIAWVTSDLLRYKTISLDKVDYFVSDEEAKVKRIRKVPANSVLATCVGEFSLTASNKCPVIVNQQIQAYSCRKNTYSEFINYQIQANISKDYFDIFATETTIKYINKEKFSLIPIFLPPLPEQKAIAHYLDTKTAQCDRKIDLLTQKAKLYGNLKQSLINETVTRGLDKTMPMCDRGIEWLGEVPEHWQNGRIKDFTVSNTAVRTPIHLSEMDLVEFIPMTNINEELGKIKQVNLVPLKDVSSGYTKFKNGDVIFAKITPCMEKGNAALVTGLKDNIGFGSTKFIFFRPSKKLLAKYLHYFLHNVLFRKNAEPFMKGTTGQKRITSFYMATHYLGLPPLTEQKAIAHYLDTKTAQIDQIIQTINSQIDKLKELCKTLINDVVTGKIKV